MNVLNLQTNKF